MRDNEKYASIVDMSDNDIQFKDKLRDCYLKISDLEAKLAESEKEKDYYQDLYFTSVKGQEKLKQQLAEKEKEIEQLKKFDDLNKTFFDLFRTAFKEPNKVDDLFNTLKTMQEKQDQDKISFTIQQLQRVKEKLSEDLENVIELLDPLEYEDYHEFIGCGRGYKNSIEEIDQIIKELEEE